MAQAGCIALGVSAVQSYCAPPVDCRLTCLNINNPPICPQVDLDNCEEACVCKVGFVLKNGKCVKPANC